MASPTLEELEEEYARYAREASYISYVRRDNSTLASRLRIRALTNTPLKSYFQNTDNLPFRPVSISPTLMQPKDLKYSVKPFQLQTEKV